MLSETEKLCSKLDRLGFKGYWLGENNWLDAFTQAAILSRASSSIRLGTSITGIYGRSPLIVAMSAASLADISQGRFVIGLGTQTEHHVRDWYGEEFKDPIVRAREYVIVVKELLGGENVTFNGEQIKVRNLSLQEKPRHGVKVMMAAIGPKMIRTAAQVADGIFGTFWSKEYIRKIVIPNARIGLEKSKRSMEEFELVCGYGTMPTGRKATEDAIKPRIVMSATVSLFRKVFEISGFGEEYEKINAAWKVGDVSAALNHVTERMISELTIVGDSLTLKRRVEGLLESGLSEVALQVFAGNAFYPLHPGHLPKNIDQFNKPSPYTANEASDLIIEAFT